jgi:tetratricopeptide (TPR) repeat protein
MGFDSLISDEIRRFEEQVRDQPESLVFARLADAYRKAGQPERALAVLEDGLYRHPNYPSGHIVRARALRDMGRVDETLEAFRRVLELDGANLVAIRELAGMADESGDVGEARHWYERLSQVDPTNLEVRQRLRELETGSAESNGTAPVDSDVEAEGPETWWDDSAVSLPVDGLVVDREWEAESETGDLVTPKDQERPEDDVVEAILNGAVPQTVRAEDTWWYEEEPDGAEPEPSKDADLLTRTMADLYAEQGLHREAAEIYEELLKDSPGDPDLLARLESVREKGKEVPVAPVVDSGMQHEVAVGAPEEMEFPGASDLSDAVEDPVPLGRPVGTPWTDEIHRLLRMGEERAGALPDPESLDRSEPAASAEDSLAGAGHSPVTGDAGTGEAADQEESAPGASPEHDWPSRLARDWIQGLETDG